MVNQFAPKARNFLVPAFNHYNMVSDKFRTEIANEPLHELLSADGTVDTTLFRFEYCTFSIIVRHLLRLIRQVALVSCAYQVDSPTLS